MLSIVGGVFKSVVRGDETSELLPLLLSRFGLSDSLTSIVVYYLYPDFKNVRQFLRSDLQLDDDEQEDDAVARLMEMWYNSGDCGKAEIEGRNCTHKDDEPSCEDYDFDFTLEGIIFRYSNFPPWMTNTDRGYEAARLAISTAGVIDDLRDAFLEDIGHTLEQ